MNSSQSFQISGLNGEKSLSGQISINGAKNAALKAMAASILFQGPVTLKNIPQTEDVERMSHLLQLLGAKVTKAESSTICIDASNIHATDIDTTLAQSMRASVVLTGPLLSRFGKVTFPAPGGCVIGARPIDLFIDAYSRMTAVTTEESCIYKINAPKGLMGANIVFQKVSVGATETLMMTAILASGTTILENCAVEPEIGNVAEWLNNCGAMISGIGTSRLVIQGRNGSLLNPQVPYRAIPDRIEAGSFLLLGALCAKELTIQNCRPDHIGSVINLLRTAGLSIDTDTDNIYIKNNTKSNSNFTSFDVRTKEYPGFPTDLQAQAVTFLTQASGQSNIIETIFEGRFKYVADLNIMGASISEINPQEILVHGPTPLHDLADSRELSAHDIRAGFAIVMAALVAKGNFKINNVHLIDRGYESLEVRLKNIGASIFRISA